VILLWRVIQGKASWSFAGDHRQDVSFECDMFADRKLGVIFSREGSWALQVVVRFMNK
jgi:hypothetical protein